jgi:hypothetical protein
LAKALTDTHAGHGRYTRTTVDETDAALPEVDRIRGFKVAAGDNVRTLVFDKPGVYHVKK